MMQEKQKKVQLRLRSKITKNRDLDSIDLRPYAIPLKADQKIYEQDLKKFCRAFARKVPAEDVRPDDMATIKCQSENPRFKKESITVRVGLGLYSKELEGSLVGMKIGESRKILADSCDVTATILSCERELIPPLTDKLAAKSRITGVETAAQARQYCRFKQYDAALEDIFDDAFSYFSGELFKSCEFSFDEEETAAALTAAKKSVSPDAQEALAKNEDAPDIDSFTKSLAQNMLTAALFGQDLSSLTEDDYEEYIDKIAAAQGCSREDARKAEPLTEYLIYTCSDIFIEETEKYVLHTLKILGEQLQ